MKLFNKLKNVLFEEEEIEVPVDEATVKIPPIEPPKKIERPVYKEKEEEPIATDRELFKAEKTFDFPAFDDHEFDSMKNISLDLTDDDEKVVKEEKESMSINLFDYDKPKIKRSVKEEKKQEEIKGRAYPTKKDEPRQTKFKPSPVISPVYGILDKNYKKEDIIVKSEPKKDIDVDVVRKKAFGTLEEDLEKTLNKPVKKFYDEGKEEKLPKVKEEKSIEDLLEETSFDVIDVKKEERKKEEKKFNTDTIELEQIDKPKVKTKEEKEEETLENDLFDLIDSMYDNREDEE